MKKLNLTLGLMLIIGICAFALTRSGVPTLRPGQSIDLDPVKLSHAGIAKQQKSPAKSVIKRAAGDRIGYYEFDENAYNAYVYFTNSAVPVAGADYIQFTVPDTVSYGAFMSRGLSTFISSYESAEKYRYTMQVEANKACHVEAVFCWLAVEDGSIKNYEIFGAYDSVQFEGVEGETAKTLEFEYEIPYGIGLPNPSIYFYMDDASGATVKFSNITCEVVEGDFYSWNESKFKVVDSWGNYAEDSKPIVGKTENSNWTYSDETGYFSIADYNDAIDEALVIPLDGINMKAGEFYEIVTEVRGNRIGNIKGELYAINEDGSEYYVGSAGATTFNDVENNVMTGRINKSHGDITNAELRIFLNWIGDDAETNELEVKLNSITLATDYVDLSTLPQTVYDDTLGLNVYTTEDGDRLGFQGAILQYIETTKEQISVPEQIVIDNSAVDVLVFDPQSEDFYIHCPNLKIIDAPSITRVDVACYYGMALERINVHRLEDTWGTNWDDLDHMVVVHADVPTPDKNYTHGENVRVLVGNETLDAPISYGGSNIFFDRDENGAWFQCVINDRFSDGSFNISVRGIYTDLESVVIPQNLTFPNDSKSYSVVRLDNNYGFTENAPNLTSISIPSSLGQICINWSQSQINEIHFRDNGLSVPSTDWYVPSEMTVYAPSREMYGLLKNNDQWNGATIMPEGWDFELLTIDVKRRGEFAQTYIEMTDADWTAGVNVKVTGKLSGTDLSNMRYMESIMTLDLSEADFDGLPAGWMSNMSSLTKVILPDYVTAIPNSAFSNCDSLTEVVAPGVTYLGDSAFSYCSRLKGFDMSNLTYIGAYAFSGCGMLTEANVSDVLGYIGSGAFSSTSIRSFVVPEKVTQIVDYVFNYCTSLETVTLPSTLTRIGDDAFRYTAIRELNVPEGVRSIGYKAFSGCYNLASVSLPSTLTDMGSNVFSDCNSLTDVVCKAVTPPAAGGYFTNGMDLTHCTLRVAPFAISEYRQNKYWGAFLIVKPLAERISDIVIERPMTFDLLSEDNDVLAGNPSMTLKYNTSQSRNGQLTAYGDGTLSAGQFTMWGFLGLRDNYLRYATSLINNAENMRADNVTISFQVYKDYWHFFSLPFDCAVSDITVNDGTDYVIRRYDSTARAAQGETVKGNSWVDVLPDETLVAGQGYIIMAANNVEVNGYSQNAYVRFNSGNTLTKNNIFRSGNYIAELKEYPAEFAHNRSWNFVGNPYPCFYRLNNLLDDFYQPVTLWRGYNYQAYSPIDDDVILRPFEAFFVQCPLETTEMAFSADGRLHFDEAMNLGADPGYRAPAEAKASERRVFNFNVEGMGSDDRARIVINPAAKRTYDAGDAAKMFAENSTAVEIYVADGVDYAICERPLDDAVATLGIKVAAKGQYTIALDSRNAAGATVELIDNVTGSIVDLTAAPYIFDAEEGIDSDRFTVRFRNIVSGIDSILDGDTEVAIFNLQGIKVYEGLIRDFNGDKGVYVVVCGENSFKVEL